MRHTGKLYLFYYLMLLIALWFGGCTGHSKADWIFETVTSEQTGITFANELHPSPAFNLFSYMYYYNGAGIGAGDFNNDGLVDLFFASNQGANALYLNRGNIRFEDITLQSGIPQDEAWSTGVSVVDINADGLLDIYVCRVGNYKVLKGKNQLLICQGVGQNGIPTYKDESEIYGLDFSGFSTHAAFFDYDLDGDTDMFLLNHSVNHDGNYAPRDQFLGTYDSLAGQRLYRNDSWLDADGRLVPVFTNVTQQAGIHGSRIGYGLGVVVSDFNLDGWPDLYIGNDFHENDYLYINQGNGRYSEQGTQSMRHTSQFTMGVDAADINNDGFPDIASMDMLPDDPQMLRRSLSEDDYNIFQHKISYGYSYQYARNNLQLNLGNGSFSEIGQFAGIYATDWTWSALFMDFDNDGHRDLFVSNGIPKRMNDIDYINFVSNETLQEKLKNNTVEDKDLLMVKNFPEIKLPNHFFMNNGDLTFSDRSDRVKNNLPTFSNGAVYADLDNDGDLDIVVNNINDVVLVYKNRTQETAPQNRYASIELKGPNNNGNAIGAKLFLFKGEHILHFEQAPVRGFLSSMQIPLHVGMGEMNFDSAFLVWPDNRYQKISLVVNATNRFVYRDSLPIFNYDFLHSKNEAVRQVTMLDLTTTTLLDHKHIENDFNEFAREALLPRMVSTEGPALAVADINGDELDDIFIGGSKSHAGAIYIQQAGGTFKLLPQPALKADSMWEHVDATWADMNGDGHPDLTIATGGNEYYGEDEHLLPLLYLNDGHGNLSRKVNAFPPIFTTQSRVLVFDFTGDQVPDLLITGRAVPWQYGIAPPSFLLENDGNGLFTDVTKEYCPQISKEGMITDIALTDVNNDGKMDMVLCYEWGTIDALIGQEKGFRRKTLYAATGWWRSLQVADMNNDGHPDIIAGNFGLNSRLIASKKEPVRLYINDFDDNGRIEQIMTYYLHGKEIPFNSKMQLERQLPGLKKKYLYAKDFSKADMKALFGKDKLRTSKVLTATSFAHVMLLNDGKGNFSDIPLPAQAQFSTLQQMTPLDVKQDGRKDLFLTGNFFDYHVELGRQDANGGLLLINKGYGQYDIQAPNGTYLEGSVRKVSQIRINNQTCYVVAINDHPVRIVRFL